MVDFFANLICGVFSIITLPLSILIWAIEHNAEKAARDDYSKVHREMLEKESKFKERQEQP